ncbi:MAG: DUF1343 domain-containing protein [Hyphomicrobiaceae bacterium]|nr:MAG: DUF1343 domain-containing protein [Hyphomicrobiaceae bacterium]
MAHSSLSRTPARSSPVATGADVLAASGFAALAGKRVGLITNQTGRVGGEHLADLLSRTPNVRLTAIFAPEHGFRGDAEAGASVRDGVDTKTGIPVYSLYGASRKPTPAMLRNVDVLVFDIQEVGARFYTYISTMGLAMQGAAAARIPFIVLDRPNPLGGEYVSGFVLERPLRSFVGQYPIPIVHGLTVGELARMIKEERWLEGLDDLDLSVVAMHGWQRSMRWPQTGRAWVATSPNIPTFESALVYPGIGIVGEAEVSEGRGTATPFSLFGAPWLEAPRVVANLNAIGLAGVRFETAVFTPHAIPRVATRPRFEGRKIEGVRVVVTDAARIEPLEVGMHVLCVVAAEARSKRVTRLFPNLKMLHAIAGTKRLHRLLMGGSDGSAIVSAWQNEVAQFKVRRARYLLY